MGATTRSAVSASLLLLVLSILISSSSAEIRRSEIRLDQRSIIPFEEFGFTHFGFLELNVSAISFSNPDPDLDLSKIGFFLSTRDAWIHVVQQIQDQEIACALESSLIKRVYSFDQLPRNPSDSHAPIANKFGIVFHVNDPGQFTLVFANCLQDLRISMDVESTTYNTEGNGGKRGYLPAGSAVLPRIYFLYFLVYACLSGFWIFILYKKRRTAFGIHYFMLAVVVLKALNLLCEAEDKSYIQKTGSAHGWDVLFYIFSFMKGITLFTLIVLIGTGWSFLHDSSPSFSRSPAMQCPEERPILGALTVDDLKHSPTSTKKSSPRKSPDVEMPIVGTVGSYWSCSSNDDGKATFTGVKGIPNTTSKYREDKRVNWHSTPFEVRLDRALKSGGTA